MAWISGRQLHWRLNSLHLQIVAKLLLGAETQHTDRVCPPVERREFTRQILDVDAGPAVDVRRILICQHSDIHGPVYRDLSSLRAAAN